MPERSSLALSSESPALPHPIVDPHPRNLIGRYVCYGAIIVCLLFFAWIRFEKRAMPLERDEGEYAYMGQLMLQGVPPFSVASNMKLPGTYAAYAAIMATFGETAAGIHTGMIFVTSMTAILVFLLGKYLWTTFAGAIAACSYLFLAIRATVLGIVAHATHFVMLAALAATLLFLYAIDRKRSSLFFYSGLLFGISFLMKQSGVFFAAFAGAYWLWGEHKVGWFRKDVIVRTALFSSGVVLPYALTCLWLLRAGVFANFWFWTWTYAREYGSLMSFSDGWHQRLKPLLQWALRPLAFWELAVLGLAGPLWSRYARARGGFIAGFFVASFLAVVPGFYFRPHYFIQVLPAGALCIGIAMECAQQELRERWHGRFAFLSLTYFVIIYLAALHGEWHHSLRFAPDALSTKLYRDDFVQSVSVASFIKSRSAPGDQIGIIGSEPEICFYTHLRCASSFLYVYPLLEKQKFAFQMQDEFKGQFTRERPRFLVYVDNWSPREWEPTLMDARPFFDWGWGFAHRGYELVEQVPFPTSEYAVHWRGAQTSFYVFERAEK